MAALTQQFSRFIRKPEIKRTTVWGALILSALIAFEIFNYSTTDFAMADLLGDLQFIGIKWSTILAIAFCSIDFAGIARLFTPEHQKVAHKEVWYLFGAWILAATMNAMLTWWGVSIAVLQHASLGNEVIDRAAMLKIVPIFVAVMVWLIRILLIGTLSVNGEKMFTRKQENSPVSIPNMKPLRKPVQSRKPVRRPTPAAARPAPAFRPAPKPPVRSERSYQPASMNSSNQGKTYHS